MQCVCENWRHRLKWRRKQAVCVWRINREAGERRKWRGLWRRRPVAEAAMTYWRGVISAVKYTALVLLFGASATQWRFSASCNGVAAIGNTALAWLILAG